MPDSDKGYTQDLLMLCGKWETSDGPKYDGFYCPKEMRGLGVSIFTESPPSSLKR